MTISILTPPRLGGPFYWARYLADSLNERGIKSEHVYQIRKLLLSPLYQNADIVHTTVPFPFKLWKKPIVLTIHGDYINERNIWQRFYPKIIAQANAITIPSRYLKQKLGLNDAIVIPNAIFPERFKQVRHSEKETINLVTIARFHFKDKARGILDILEILSVANKIANKRIKYVVVGGGPYLGRIMAQAKSYDIDVEFTGMLQNPKTILENSDIFVYYSHHDSFGIVLLEAMASGLPVITNNFGPPSEIIDNEKNGYIAEGDESYLKYLLSLLGDYKLRQKIGQNARAKIEEKFDWDKIVDSYIEIYKVALRYI